MNRFGLLPALVILGVLLSGDARALSSYATAAVDVTGSTGSAAVALGVPDYAFINDAGLPFGGTSTDVFDPGETAEFQFPGALRNVAGQEDLIISAFVGGLGATDNATVQVEVSSDGAAFQIVATFDTEEARDRPEDRAENDFEGVKHFRVEFGTADDVTHVRLTNLAGTAEGLRLDAIEGLHPAVDSTHAFELRIERYRPDVIQQFKLRVKNLSASGGVPIRELRIDRAMAFPTALEATIWSIEGLGDTEFICVENCIPNDGPLIPFARYAWSTDGVAEAPPGVGLDPGRQAAHDRPRSIDVETLTESYLEGFTFTVTFTDGFSHSFLYDDAMLDVGELYQKYLYSSSAPEESGPRQVDFYEFVRPDTEVPEVPLFPYLP